MLVVASTLDSELPLGPQGHTSQLLAVTLLVYLSCGSVSLIEP